jgi:glycosyltransferase involved in cell wall biosynthesis
VTLPTVSPLVSAVLAVFNADGFIERALPSVQRQTYNNIKIIVIDDGSIDNTARLCARRFRDRPYSCSHSSISTLHSIFCSGRFGSRASLS